jgi:hypothetical protein
MISGLLKRLKIRTLLLKGECEGGVMPPIAHHRPIFQLIRGYFRRRSIILRLVVVSLCCQHLGWVCALYYINLLYVQYSYILIYVGGEAMFYYQKNKYDKPMTGGL